MATFCPGCLPRGEVRTTIGIKVPAATLAGRRREAETPVSENAIVAETAARIFADLGDPQEVNRARDGAWTAPLWRALVDAGLTLAWVPEEQGGPAADSADGLA